MSDSVYLDTSALVKWYLNEQGTKQVMDFIHAFHLIDSFPTIPLRTLDALHLSIIQQKNIPRLATADDVMFKAAKKMNISVKKF